MATRTATATQPPAGGPVVGPPPLAPQDVPAGTVVLNAVKGIADVTLPGASLLFEGDIKSGTLHVVSGLVAKALFGPIGWLAVAADAFSLSTTGKHIYQQFGTVDIEVNRNPPPPPPPPPANS